MLLSPLGLRRVLFPVAHTSQKSTYIQTRRRERKSSITSPIARYQSQCAPADCRRTASHQPTVNSRQMRSPLAPARRTLLPLPLPLVHLLLVHVLLFVACASGGEPAARHCSEAYRACLHSDPVCRFKLTALWTYCGNFGAPLPRASPPRAPPLLCLLLLLSTLVSSPLLSSPLLSSPLLSSRFLCVRLRSLRLTSSPSGAARRASANQ